MTHRGSIHNQLPWGGVFELTKDYGHTGPQGGKYWAYHLDQEKQMVDKVIPAGTRLLLTGVRTFGTSGTWGEAPPSGQLQGKFLIILDGKVTRVTLSTAHAVRLDEAEEAALLAELGLTLGGATPRAEPKGPVPGTSILTIDDL